MVYAFSNKDHNKCESDDKLIINEMKNFYLDQYFGN